MPTRVFCMNNGCQLAKNFHHLSISISSCCDILPPRDVRPLHVIFEVQLSVASLDDSSVLNRTTSDLILSDVPPPDVHHLGDNEKLTEAKSSKREAMPELVRRFPVDLPGDDPSSIRNRLL